MVANSRCTSRGTAFTICSPEGARRITARKGHPRRQRASRRPSGHGYGPARYLLPGEVGQVADALANFPISQALEAYDPEKAETLQVYVPHHQPEELKEMFHLLRDFYATAADEDEAMLLWIH